MGKIKKFYDCEWTCVYNSATACQFFPISHLSRWKDLLHIVQSFATWTLHLIWFQIFIYNYLWFYLCLLLVLCHAAMMPLRWVNGLFYVCVCTGACGVSVPHHFHGGGVPEGNSLRPALPPQRLPEERLESARLHHCSCRVSDQNHTEKRQTARCYLMVLCYSKWVYEVWQMKQIS